MILRPQNRNIRFRVPLKSLIQLRPNTPLPLATTNRMQILLDLLDERIQIFDSNAFHEAQVPVVALDHAAEDIPQGDEDASDFITLDVDDVLEE